MPKFPDKRMTAGRGAHRMDGQVLNDPLAPIKQGALGARKAIVNGVMAGGAIGGAVGKAIKTGAKAVGNQLDIAKNKAFGIKEIPELNPQKVSDNGYETEPRNNPYKAQVLKKKTNMAQKMSQ